VLARVYDAAVEQRDDADVAYVIREWVDGTPLPEVLERDGAYAPGAAVALATALLEGLAVAHAAGWRTAASTRATSCSTGRAPCGSPTSPSPQPCPTGAWPPSAPGTRAGRGRRPGRRRRALRPAHRPLAGRRDAAAVAGVPGAPALRDRPTARGRLVSPRQVRARVPTALDAAVMRALDPAGRAAPPELRSADGLLDVLEGVVRADRPARASSVRRSAGRGRLAVRLRRHAGTLCVAVLLTVVGIAAYAAGREVGTVEAPPGQAAPTAPAGGDVAGPSTAPVDLARVAVRDFDPEGDGQERPGSVANAHDGDPSTAWETERYDSAGFGGLKDGVGLLLDLGAPTAVRRVEVALTRAGVSAELRAADEPLPDADAYRVLARAGPTATGSRSRRPRARPSGTCSSG
jgi:hypothetical protein